MRKFGMISALAGFGLLGIVVLLREHISAGPWAWLPGAMLLSGGGALIVMARWASPGGSADLLAVTLFLGGWHAPLAFLEFVPSYLWFFLKLSLLIFVFIWVRGTLPRSRVDQVMNFAWKFMLPMAFTCVVSAAVWYYSGRRLAGWLWSSWLYTCSASSP